AGKTLVAGALDGTLKMWDLASNQEPVTLHQGAPVTRLYFSSDGETLIAGGHGPTRVWEVATAKEREVLPVSIRDGVLSPDLKVLMTRSPDGANIQLLEATTGRQLATMAKYSPAGPGCAAFAADGNSFATGGLSAQLWDVKGGSLRATLPVISQGTTSQI